MDKKALYGSMLRDEVPGLLRSTGPEREDLGKWEPERNKEVLGWALREYNMALASGEITPDLKKWNQFNQELIAADNREKANNSLAPNMKAGVER